MSSDQHNVPHSTPIPIDSSAHRRRSGSMSSDSSGSPTTPLATPISSNLPKVSTASPSTSPILSYFMSQSPTAKTFPFRRGTISSFAGNGSVSEEEDSLDLESKSKVNRRATTTWAGHGSERFQQHTSPMTDDRQERATGLLRRLSLSTSFAKPPGIGAGSGAGERIPAAPPNTAYPISPTSGSPQNQQNLSPGRKPVQRAPSPMGERILKGHFDGFN